MKAIVVDDEPLALNHLAEEIERLSELRVIGKYRNPKDALEAIYKDHPEVVFLDIEMPEMSGIQLAEHILARLPKVQVVFVTVYDEYAVRAFEIQAIDYILKPLREDRLIKTLSRLQQSISIVPQSEKPQATFRIHCFRSLQFKKTEKAPATIRWKTFKAQELFCYLLYKSGQPVRKSSIVEELWPEIDWKRGVTQLYTAIYQIRKILETEEIPIQLKNVDEGYMLEMHEVVLDIVEWEDELKKLPSLTNETVQRHLHVFSLYRGDYLGEYGYLWAEREMKRLQEMWFQHAKQITAFYISFKRESEAAAFYLRVQQLMPREESVYFELMQLYGRIGDRFSVERQYELLAVMLDKEMGLEPHHNVKEWFKDWRRQDFDRVNV